MEILLLVGMYFVAGFLMGLMVAINFPRFAKTFTHQDKK
jgi:hypothetical protein